MSKLTGLLVALLVLASVPIAVLPALAQDDAATAATIQNDEGGPVIIDGEMNYTNPLLALGVAQPLIILEDQAGFVDRDRGFIMPPESQTLGVITGDFFEPPFGWTLALPAVPQGTLRDVDNDGEEDEGVMTFAVAYWTNIFGDPYLERRDLQGGGWSTAFATTRVEGNPSGKGEVIGGQFVVWAPDDQQGFPSGFGADGLLFTEDDPIVTLPQGYTIVDMDTDPFTFDRSARPQMELIEPESFALDDFSGLSYTEAFDAMIAKMRNEYAFTEYKGIDWDALVAEFRPRFEEAEADGDSTAYRRALRDFTWAIPDGHVGGPFVQEDFVAATAGGLGMAIREVEDGRTIVNFVTPEGPAAAAGIELGAEILEMGGEPVADYVDTVQPFSAPFSTEHFERLQQLRYASRYPLGEQIDVTYRNPGAAEAQTATLTAAEENDSFRFSSFSRGRTGAELPVDFEVLDNGLGLVRIYSFSDNELLTVQLWEQMMTSLNGLGIPGLIIDMRQNGGGSGFLADQMAAYFFNEELELGNAGYYDEKEGTFVFDERTIDRFYLPDESLRYGGRVALIVGPNCVSACEFFSYDMLRQGRADVVGSYPTGGLGGSIGVFSMPDMEMLQFTVGRAVDMNGEIHIEGKGVAPTVDVPVTEETLFYEGDVLLDTTVALLADQPLPFGAAPSGAAVQPEAAEEETAAATEEAVTESAAEATPEVTEEATAEPTGEATPEATPEATTEDAAAPATALAAGQTVSIVSDSGRVRVYTQPGSAGQIRGFVTNGTTWEVLEVSDDDQWVRINFRGTEPGGWVNAASVKVSE
jgi:C-terminal processing protease CtpA/Prc